MISIYSSSDISYISTVLFEILIGFFLFSPWIFCADMAFFVDLLIKAYLKLRQWSSRILALFLDGVCDTEWSPGTCRISEKAG